MATLLTFSNYLRNGQAQHLLKSVNSSSSLTSLRVLYVSSSSYSQTSSLRLVTARTTSCSTGPSHRLYPESCLSTLPFRKSTPWRLQLTRAFSTGGRDLQKRGVSNSPPSANEKPKQSVLAPSKILAKLTPHENIWTIPNILTFTRLFSAPLVGYFIVTSQPHLALGLFVYAGITDLVDGYIARHFNQATVVGTVIDPMADKLLMTICVICLATQSALPIWLVTLILGRDVGLAISAIYIRWISLPPPKTMARYWDFSLPSAEARPTEISKYNTFFQLVVVGAAMVLPVLSQQTIEAWQLGLVNEYFQYFVGFTTVWSGASYLYTRDAFTILTQEEIDKRVEEKKKERVEQGGK